MAVNYQIYKKIQCKQKRIKREKLTHIQIKQDILGTIFMVEGFLAENVQFLNIR